VLHLLFILFRTLSYTTNERNWHFYRQNVYINKKVFFVLYTRGCVKYSRNSAEAGFYTLLDYFFSSYSEAVYGLIKSFPNHRPLVTVFDVTAVPDVFLPENNQLPLTFPLDSRCSRKVNHESKSRIPVDRWEYSICSTLTTYYLVRWHPDIRARP